LKVENVESFSVVSADIKRQVPSIGLSFFSELQEAIVMIKTRIDNAFFMIIYGLFVKFFQFQVSGFTFRQLET
jgi:hypothetical protein